LRHFNQETYDILIKNGQIVDGSGKPPTSELSSNADTIVSP
jgi:N-acyl-D-aspartate/D-glutamate deacylase